MINFGILAAGNGRRLKEDGTELPKPLVDIDGEPMIGRLVRILRQSGAGSISIAINSDMPEVAGYLHFLEDDLKCDIPVVECKTTSSMHTFHELVRIMKPQHKFLVTTVDAIFREEIFIQFIDAFGKLPEGVTGLMGVSDYIDDEKPLYVKTDAMMNILSFSDSNSRGSEYVSAGIYGFTPEVIPTLNECMETGIKRMRNFQRKILESGLILKAFNLGKVIDVDHPGDIDKANFFLNQHK